MTESVDSRPDTYAHILEVQRLLLRAISDLQDRLTKHDLSKLESPELEAYDVMTIRLRNVPYGSFEYRSTLREMKPAIDHHFANNSHHPEHNPNGVQGMSLLDLIEMLCDWKAASKRHPNSLSLAASIDVNQARFGYSDDVRQLFHNTARLFDQEEPTCLPSMPTPTAANTAPAVTSPTFSPSTSTSWSHTASPTKVPNEP